MRLSDRYIFSELLPPFLVSTFAVLMMLVGNTLYAVLDRMLQEKWPVLTVARMLILNIPVVLTMTLPVAVALSGSLAVNRMARDGEMTTLRAAGQPLWRTFIPVFIFGAMVSVGDFYLSEKVVPWSFKEQRNVEALLYGLPKDPVTGGRSIAVDDYLVSFNTAQQTVKGKRFRFNKVVIFYNPNRFPGQNDGEYATIQLADSAEYENGVWYLSNPRLYRFNADGSLTGIGTGDVAKVNLRIDFSAVYNPPSDFEMNQQSFGDLTAMQNEATRQRRYKDARKIEVNRYFKLSLPLMCFVFALCSPPLSLRFARTGAFTGVLLSIVVVFVAWNTLLLMKAVGLGGYVSPLFAALITPILFTGLGVFLLRAQE
ncbi:MAG: LptF/LptG family permease [Armatimonadetes bacterium]|nr:LptF/LptG family permease [Armatimonadota bacterium]